jgi:GTPase
LPYARPLAPVPSTPERCRLLLEHWRRGLRLSRRERGLMGGQLQLLDQQLERLQQRRLRVAVFGRVGVGKSSLLNALLGRDRFATDVAHGCTRHQQVERWPIDIDGLAEVELVDTPGIDEIAAAARARLAARLALNADLVLLVLDGDLNRIELEALSQLAANRALASLRRRLPQALQGVEIVAVAAAPRQPQLLADGRVRSEAAPARIAPLQRSLQRLLSNQGDLLLALGALHSADRFHQTLHQGRLRHSRSAAQGLIGRYAALKATGVAANPLMLLDLAGGLACDTALVLQLCELYGMPMHSQGARALLTRLSSHNAMLGGVQLGIQLLLGGLRQLLVLAAPFSGGLSLAPAAPVALAQAALAVHTTRLTGSLAAAELLKGAQRGPKPAALLARLARHDPAARAWLQTWQPASSTPPLQSLLP